MLCAVTQHSEAVWPYLLGEGAIAAGVGGWPWQVGQHVPGGGRLRGWDGVPAAPGLLAWKPGAAHAVVGAETVLWLHAAAGWKHRGHSAGCCGNRAGLSGGAVGRVGSAGLGYWGGIAWSCSQLLGAVADEGCSCEEQAWREAVLPTGVPQPCLLHAPSLHWDVVTVRALRKSHGPGAPQDDAKLSLTEAPLHLRALESIPWVRNGPKAFTCTADVKTAPAHCLAIISHALEESVFILIQVFIEREVECDPKSYFKMQTAA